MVVETVEFCEGSAVVVVVVTVELCVGMLALFCHFSFICLCTRVFLALASNFWTVPSAKRFTSHFSSCLGFMSTATSLLSPDN